MATQYAGGGGVGGAALYEPLTNGLLTAVSAFADTGGSGAASLMVEVSIVRGGHGGSFRRVHLATGFIGATEPFTWHGAEPIDVNDELRFYIAGDLTPIVYFHHTAVTPHAGGPIQEILRDAVSVGS